MTITYSEKSEGASSRKGYILQVFKTGDKNSTLFRNQSSLLGDPGWSYYCSDPQFLLINLKDGSSFDLAALCWRLTAIGNCSSFERYCALSLLSPNSSPVFGEASVQSFVLYQFTLGSAVHGLQRLLLRYVGFETRVRNDQGPDWREQKCR
jgi:hypothetical protein